MIIRAEKEAENSRIDKVMLVVRTGEEAEREKEKLSEQGYINITIK